MKTPTPITTDSTVLRHSRHSGMLLLLTTLALVCGGSTLGPMRGDQEPQEPRTHSAGSVAQSDITHQVAAKLSSLNGVVRVGVGLFLCGLLSLSRSPLRALTRGGRTRLALLLGGVILMVLPTLVVGNELLVLAALAVVGGGWLLACSRTGRGARQEKRPHSPHPAPDGSGS